jgi:hypothetical protein
LVSDGRFFQGAFTYYMSIAGISGSGLLLDQVNSYVLLGCSFQIAGAYPLTQVYQHQQDLKDGITTLSYKLGYIGTFLFTALMFLLCNVFYYLYFTARDLGMIFYIIQVFFIPIVVFFGYWFYLVSKDSKQANFRNTMRMNWVAAICMNSCFIVLIIINRIPLSYLSAIETAVPDYCLFPGKRLPILPEINKRFNHTRERSGSSPVKRALKRAIPYPRF